MQNICYRDTILYYSKLEPSAHKDKRQGTLNQQRLAQFPMRVVNTGSQPPREERRENTGSQNPREKDEGKKGFGSIYVNNHKAMSLI